MDADDTYVLLVAGDHIRDEYVDLLRRLELPIAAWADCHQAVQALRPTAPLVAVLEVEHGGCSLLRDMRDHYAEQVPVMLVSANRTDPADVVAGLLVGADDYASESMDADEFLARVRRLADRGRTADHETPAALRLASLTTREREILSLTSEGLTQKQVAAQLGISIKTVGAHIQSLLQKLGVHSRVEAVALAVRADQSQDSPAPPSMRDEQPQRGSSTRARMPAAPGNGGASTIGPTPRTASR